MKLTAHQKKQHITSRVSKWHQPETESFVIQEAVPTWLVTSILYSPASALSVERIFREATFFEKDIRYLVPEDSTVSSLNHLIFSSGEPDTLTSKFALSPDFTFKDSGLSTISAGSRNQGKDIRPTESSHRQH